MHESGTAKISSSEQDETGRENCHVLHWANMNGGASLSLRPLYRELPSAGLLLMQVNDKTSKATVSVLDPNEDWSFGVQIPEHEMFCVCQRKKLVHS